MNLWDIKSLPSDLFVNYLLKYRFGVGPSELLVFSSAGIWSQVEVCPSPLLYSGGAACFSPQRWAGLVQSTAVSTVLDSVGACWTRSCRSPSKIEESFFIYSWQIAPPPHQQWLGLLPGIRVRWRLWRDNCSSSSIWIILCLIFLSIKKSI